MDEKNNIEATKSTPVGSAPEYSNKKLINDAASLEKTKEDNKIKEIVIEANNEINEDAVTLSTPVKFEGQVVKEIDMSRLKDMTGIDAQNIEKIYRKTTKNLSAAPETTTDYAIAAASYITELPVEFFKQLNLRDITKIKNRVINFIYAED